MNFITFDMAAATLCKRVALMYRGRIVELRSAGKVFTHHMHSYPEMPLGIFDHSLVSQILASETVLLHVGGSRPTQ